MTRNAAIALALGSLIVLGGAWVVSRALTAEITVPAWTPPAPLPFAEPAPRAEARRDPPPPPAPPAPPAPVDTTTAVREPPQGLQPAPADPATGSAYAREDSPEVVRAWELTSGPKSGPPQWRAAQKLFTRCVTQAPENARCREGLATVKQQLDGLDAPAQLRGARPRRDTSADE